MAQFAWQRLSLRVVVSFASFAFARWSLGGRAAGCVAGVRVLVAELSAHPPRPAFTRSIVHVAGRVIFVRGVNCTRTR